MIKRNNILTIAGFDPSGGAGVLADVKTFEQHKCVGMAVQTANTIQTEDQFESVNWLDEKLVFKQLQTLLESYKFDYIKIGLIPNITFLKKVIETCTQVNPKTKFIWDPVLSASSGFDFKQDFTDLNSILTDLFLITPNWEEIKKLTGNENVVKGAEQLSELVNVYLKGGHNPDNLGKDFLYSKGQVKSYNPKQTSKTYYPKHGSGCVLSSALACNLSNGYTLQKSILKSKRYIEGFLGSSVSLLGGHRI